LFKNPDRRLISVNVQPFDAMKHHALSVVGDARTALAALDAKLDAWKAPRAWSDEAAKAKAEWEATAASYTAPTNAPAPTDAEVLGALMRKGEKSDVVVCAAGGPPGELHKLWRAGAPLGYHSNTAIPAWATKSPLGSASRWLYPTGNWWWWSATARIS
jgi:3D-(3,5/4)-trihydroxycyclohexane-1,2-dione acylhydrolase (decyclizing)